MDNVAMPIGIGETLREARVAAGMELDDAERTLRIRVRYLDALENEEWDVLPAEAYIKAFLHTYADFLGLDGAALVDEYERRAAPQEPDRPMERPFEPPRPAVGNPFWRRVGWSAIAVAGALAALFIVLGITGGSGDTGNGHKHRASRHGDSKSTSTTTTTTTTPTDASVSLTPTGTVWVCLVDQSGKPLVNGETLSAGDSRGPFKSRELKLTVGNGEINIDLNGKAVPIPSSANPVGFDLTPQGARPLSTAGRPTCA
jgi:cytoskeleton protein RodZ